MHSRTVVVVVVGIRIFKSRPAETSQQPRDSLVDKEQCILMEPGPSRPLTSLS